MGRKEFRIALQFFLIPGNQAFVILIKNVRVSEIDDLKPETVFLCI